MWVYLCDYTTGENLETLRGHHGPVHSVKFAPGGETFASGSEDGTIRLWKTESTEEDGVRCRLVLYLWLCVYSCLGPRAICAVRPAVPLPR